MEQREATEKELQKFRKLAAREYSEIASIKPLFNILVPALLFFILTKDLIVSLIWVACVLIVMLIVQFVEKRMFSSMLEKDLKEKQVIHIVTNVKPHRGRYGFTKYIKVINTLGYYHIIDFGDRKYKIGDPVSFTAFPYTKIVISVSKRKHPDTNKNNQGNSYA